MHTPPLTNRLLLAAWAVTGCAAVAAPACGQPVNEEFKLLPNDGVAGDLFGSSVAIDGGVIAVGAPRAIVESDLQGTVYLFDAAIPGPQLSKLQPARRRLFVFFGSSVAVQDGIVAVGDPFARGNDNSITAGAAVLFHAATGEEIRRLNGSSSSPSDQLGTSIAVGDGMIVIGALWDGDNGIESGSAYVFDAATGAELFRLLPSDPAELQDFGASVAIGNGIIAVGAPFDHEMGISAGAVYLFDASTGEEVSKIFAQTSPSSVVMDFGTSVDIDGGVLAVGAPNEIDFDYWPHSGRVYLFDTATGTQLAGFRPNDKTSFFGWSVAIDNGLVAVGAEGSDDNGPYSGAAYIFDASTGAQLAKLLPSDGAEEDRFGIAIDIDGGIVVVGARRVDDNGLDAGAAYVFDLNCHADLTGDGLLDFFDVSVFLNAYNAQDPIADFNADGVFDFFDVQVFLTAFAAGCPLGS